MILGAHIGIAEGLPEAARTARSIGCDSMQIFSKSPQMWAGPPLAPEAVAAFRDALGTERIRATAVHHGYLANLASPKRATVARSRRAFLDELRRAELLGVDGLVLHPGAHMGSGVEAGIRTLAGNLREVLEMVPDGKVRVLLENAAGQGTALGSRLEELSEMIAQANAPSRLGVCLDTCHLFASGVDFRTDEQYGRLVDRIESVLGRPTVRAFHLNDSKADLGAHLDRHENIGKGFLGVEGFRHLVNDPRWEAVPGYLETPLGEKADGYAAYVADLATLRSLLGPAPEPTRSPAGRRAPRTAISTVK